MLFLYWFEHFKKNDRAIIKDICTPGLSQEVSAVEESHQCFFKAPLAVGQELGFSSRVL